MKLYKNINGKRIELTEAEVNEKKDIEEKIKKDFEKENFIILKENKIQELKSKRDDYLYNNETGNNYLFSENDKFNIINLIGYTEEEKENYINFVKNSLVTKYNKFKDEINEAESVEELEGVSIEFMEKEEEVETSTKNLLEDHTEAKDEEVEETIQESKVEAVDTLEAEEKVQDQEDK